MHLSLRGVSGAFSDSKLCIDMTLRLLGLIQTDSWAEACAAWYRQLYLAHN